MGDWGAQPPGVFSACQVKAVVDNGYDLPTQEQDTPIWVCAGTTLPWSQVWSMLKHIDSEASSATDKLGVRCGMLAMMVLCADGVLDGLCHRRLKGRR